MTRYWALGVLSDVCSLSVECGLTFPMWAKEIVHMIPKETGVDLLTKMRPLKLQEALKKVAVGIKEDRMVNAWQRAHVRLCVCCQAHLDKPACVVVGDAATEWICDYAPRIRGQGLGAWRWR
jgi:hypothetical protein